MKHAGWGLPVLLIAASASAESPPAALATVEIVGTAPIAGPGVERRLLPYSLQTATSERIADTRSDNLADFMNRHLAGVNVNDISGSPFQSDVTYRGFRASPVLGSAQGISVYLDGVRINEPFGDVINWDMLPEAAIGQMQLVPGSNPAYGFNTLGGALALTGKSGASHPGRDIHVSASGFGRKRVDAAAGMAGSQGWHTFASMTLFDDAGWREHSPGRLANVYAKLGRDSKDSGWTLSLLAGRSKLRGNGLLPDAMALENRRAAYSHPDQTRNQLQQATASMRSRIGNTAELSSTAYVRSSRRDTVNGDVELDEGELEGEFNTTRTRQRSQGASVLLAIRRAHHRIDIGATFDRSTVSYAQFRQDGILTEEREVLPDPEEETESASSVIGRARAAGVFITDTWRIAGATHITASGRVSHARVNNTLTSERGPQAPESFAYRSVNPALGIAHEAAHGLTLVANLSQGNRVPTVIELGCADPQQPCQLPVGLQADPYLKQVIARTIEVGARYQRSGLSGTVSLYQTGSRDDILFISSGITRLGYFANFERTLHRGLDASASVIRGAWSWRASYSYLDASYDAPGVLFTGLRTVAITRGTPLPGLPRHTLKLGVDWRAAPTLLIGVDAQALSRMGSQGNEDGLLADPDGSAGAEHADLRIRGHALVSARASWEPAANWEIYLRVNNLLDRRYETFGAVARDLFSTSGREGRNSRFVAPGAPRSVTAGVRFRY